MSKQDYQFKTDNYEVVLGKVQLEDGSYTDGYNVRNTGTGVVEHTTTILPEAIMWAKTLSTDLTTHLAEEAADEVLTH